MTTFARAERLALLDTLAAVGPHAPTLCGDWTTADLAGHLAARERRPESAAGLMIPALAAWSEQVRLGYARRPYPRLLDLLRVPPWWSPFAVDAIDALANAAEMFVHHEDVRRAGPDWDVRPLSRQDAETLWSRLGMARILLRGAGMRVKLVGPGYGQRTFGSGPIDATVTGDPGELMLFCFGRQPVTRVEVTGPRAEELRRADLGL